MFDGLISLLESYPSEPAVFRSLKSIESGKYFGKEGDEGCIVIYLRRDGSVWLNDQRRLHRELTRSHYDAVYRRYRDLAAMDQQTGGRIRFMVSSYGERWAKVVDKKLSPYVARPVVFLHEIQWPIAIGEKYA